MHTPLEVIGTIGFFVAVAMWIWILVIAWRKSPWWFVFVAFIFPLGFAWFICTFKRECTKPVAIMVIGLLTFGILCGYPGR